jgi:PAS domain-containing protein
MSKHIDKLEHPTPLRRQAEMRIKEGASPHATHRWSTGVEALTLLHGLASAPSSAGDALKLLHELQVYQVELDLQYEQMELSQRELIKELDHYVDLYKFAPIAYFVVDMEGKIIDANRVAAHLFNSHPDDLNGKRFNSILTSESRPALAELWKRLRNGYLSDRCEVQFDAGEQGLRSLQIIANISPHGQHFLLTLLDQTEPCPSGAPAEKRS